MKPTETDILAGAAVVAAAVAFWLLPNEGSSQKLLSPVPGTRLSSGFGNRKHPVTGQVAFHNGIDLAVPLNTTVRAPADGVVSSQYSNATGGKQMLLKHDNGLTTGYAHLNGYAVAVGARVRAGQGIAYTGNTGNSTGPHLHFTVRDAAGTLQDPIKFLAGV